eukprot:9495546-Pyramimonas_sp.AAC.1
MERRHVRERLSPRPSPLRTIPARLPPAAGPVLRAGKARSPLLVGIPGTRKQLKATLSAESHSAHNEQARRAATG